MCQARGLPRLPARPCALVEARAAPETKLIMNLRRHLAWAGVAILGAASLATVALSRGETISALWVVAAALCVYLIAYRYYSLFIANKVLGLDASRQTPAWKHNDGLDYVPTNKNILYGHHFAAIA